MAGPGTGGVIELRLLGVDANVLLHGVFTLTRHNENRNMAPDINDMNRAIPVA